LLLTLWRRNLGIAEDCEQLAGEKVANEVEVEVAKGKELSSELIQFREAGGGRESRRPAA
jgi:hypothetical protein